MWARSEVNNLRKRLKSINLSLKRVFRLGLLEIESQRKSDDKVRREHAEAMERLPLRRKAENTRQNKLQAVKLAFLISYPYLRASAMLLHHRDKTLSIGSGG